MTLEWSTLLSPDEVHRLDVFRRQHRTAPLAVGFVDLVHSTELAERIGDERFTLVLGAMAQFVRGQTEAEGSGAGRSAAPAPPLRPAQGRRHPGQCRSPR